jgi:hypothetical protein
VPEFKIIREPLEGDPNFLIMDIQLPKVVSLVYKQEEKKKSSNYFY